ncbi:MAG: biopolymer transporter ExbD [Spirochaetia bacterium]|nr:biopolymer transporter ExbD [Spirochaetota bacterium]MCX8096824.1 biopolymer transporter ExbD [Spirochaetota bacterium]MDW8112793.1 biopolymer transporter ExbD [Spirochaetia bacterium]
MNNSRSRRNTIRVGIEPTPLIDVMFLLTIFFMLTSTIIKTSSINVNLPKSIISDSQPRTQIIVTITRDNKLFLNDYPISLQDLSSAIKRITVRDPNVPVIIRGDKDIPYQMVIEVMDRVRIGGAVEVSLSVEQKR